VHDHHCSGARLSAGAAFPPDDPEVMMSAQGPANRTATRQTGTLPPIPQTRCCRACWTAPGRWPLSATPYHHHPGRHGSIDGYLVASGVHTSVNAAFRPVGGLREPNPGAPSGPAATPLPGELHTLGFRQRRPCL